MAAQPAMCIGGVQKVELSPSQVTHRRGNGLYSSRLRTMGNTADEGDGGAENPAWCHGGVVNMRQSVGPHEPRGYKAGGDDAG